MISAQPVILNTRPAAQAKDLTNLLSENNFKVVEIPLIEIKDNVSHKDIPKYKQQWQNSDLLIFISLNAIRYFFRHFVQTQTKEKTSLLFNTTTAVIGKSTAQAFARHAGREADIIPQAGSDSEALLSHPKLKQLISQKGKKLNVVIVRGKGGREFLAEQLRLVNANVDYMEVYKRVCPVYKESFLLNLEKKIGSYIEANKWNTDAIGFMIITSGESLDNLMQLTLQRELDAVLKTDLIVIHHKIQQKALQYGFSGKILLTQTASNTSILQTLLKEYK